MNNMNQGNKFAGMGGLGVSPKTMQPAPKKSAPAAGPKPPKATPKAGGKGGCKK